MSTWMVSSINPRVLHFEDCWHFWDDDVHYEPREATAEEEISLGICFHCGRRALRLYDADKRRPRKRIVKPEPMAWAR